MFFNFMTWAPVCLFCLSMQHDSRIEKGSPLKSGVFNFFHSFPFSNMLEVK